MYIYIYNNISSLYIHLFMDSKVVFLAIVNSATMYQWGTCFFLKYGFLITTMVIPSSGIVGSYSSSLWT